MSTDGGTVWIQKDSYFDDGGCCIVHPDSANLILTGGKGPITQTNWSFVVAYSRNGGNSWTRRNLSGTDMGFCRALAIAPSQRNVVYAGGNVTSSPAVYRSTDFGSSWARTAGSPGDTVYNLAVHPANANLVYAATPSGLFRTSDAGASWTNLRGGIELRAVELYAGCPDTIFIGGDSGVSVSTDAGANWSLMNAGLQTRRVTSLVFADRGGDYLIAGTAGRACFAWSLTTGIAALESGSGQRSLVVLPNPFLSCARAPGHEQDIVSVFDHSGRKVQTCLAARIGSGLSAGVYFVRGLATEPVRIVKTR